MSIAEYPRNRNLTISEQKLRTYIEKGKKSVAGWLEPLALKVISSISEEQDVLQLRGAICEIGVHKGRLLVLLKLLAKSDEQVVGCDLFELMGDLEAAYGKYDRAALENTFLRHADLENLKLIACVSTRLSSEDALREVQSRVRLFSIDGGHDAEVALSNLRVARVVLLQGGVVVVDDVFNEQWCGVAEAVCRVMLEERALVPFLAAGNKLLLTTDSKGAEACSARMQASDYDAFYKTERFSATRFSRRLPASTAGKGKSSRYFSGDGQRPSPATS
jgi:hypothetical protein